MQRGPLVYHKKTEMSKKHFCQLQAGFFGMQYSFTCSPLVHPVLLNYSYTMHNTCQLLKSAGLATSPGPIKRHNNLRIIVQLCILEHVTANSGYNVKRLVVSDTKETLAGIRRELNRSEESRYVHRLHGILLACNGLSCYDIAKVLGHSARTIEQWLHSFDRKGFEGLHEQPGRGRPGRVDPEVERPVEQDIQKDPRTFGHQRETWDGNMLSRHLHERYGITIGVRQCQRLLTRLTARIEE